MNNTREHQLSLKAATELAISKGPVSQLGSEGFVGPVSFHAAQYAINISVVKEKTGSSAAVAGITH